MNFWQIHDALMGGFGAAAGYTLQFDILPVGPDGRPTSAARDMSVQVSALADLSSASMFY